MLATVSDRKIAVSANGTAIDYYSTDVVSAQDYYPFGMIQPGRSYNNGGYRYGFNGKENDNEVKGEGNQQDYGMRIYDPRLGRFLSVDPLSQKFAWYTPYQFAGNIPIALIDMDGAEPLYPGQDITIARHQKEHAAELYKKDPKHAAEILRREEKDAFLFVASMLTGGSGSLFNWFLAGVATHGIYKVTKGVVTKNASDVEDGVHSLTYAVIGKVMSYATSKIISYYFSVKTPAFKKLGYRYESRSVTDESGTTNITHYLIKEQEEIMVGLSEISKDGKFSNIFNVPEALQKQGISTAMYAELETYGFTKVSGNYLNGSGELATNFKEFMKVYNPAKNNAVEAAYATPAGKAMGKGWTPTNISVKENSVKVDWIKTK